MATTRKTAAATRSKKRGEGNKETSDSDPEAEDSYVDVKEDNEFFSQMVYEGFRFNDYKGRECEIDFHLFTNDLPTITKNLGNPAAAMKAFTSYLAK